MSRVALACGLALLVTGGGCRSAPPSADSRLVTGWMRALYALVRAERLSPPVAARVFAYGAVALYEGLRPGSPQLKSLAGQLNGDRKSTRLNSSHTVISYAVFCLKKKNSYASAGLIGRIHE